MFEGQPKGLYALALANTGERFGYYTMLAIFTLFLQAKFGYSAGETPQFSAVFLGAWFILCRFLVECWPTKYGFGKMVTLGIFIMFIGYLLLAVPTGADVAGKSMMFGALALVACGTGLFKGNLQVMVGNLYDAPEYRDKRDTAFSLFYMAINIGALFAPTAATKMTNYVLGMNGFTYNAQIPALAHQYMDNAAGMTAQSAATLESLKAAQGFTGDTAVFCQSYIEKLSEAYNYGFAVACVSLIVSILIYYGFRSTFSMPIITRERHLDGMYPWRNCLRPRRANASPRFVLCLPWCSFSWMAFHQNGLTLTFFARDYTQASASGLLGMTFNVFNLVLIIALVYAMFSLFQSRTGRGKLVSGLVAVASVGVLAGQYAASDAEVEILPQIFQQFNRSSW